MAYQQLYERDHAAFASLRWRSCIQCVIWCLFVFIAVMLYVRFSFFYDSCSYFLSSISQLSSPSLFPPPKLDMILSFVYPSQNRKRPSVISFYSWTMCAFRASMHLVYPHQVTLNGQDHTSELHAIPHNNSIITYPKYFYHYESNKDA